MEHYYQHNIRNRELEERRVRLVKRKFILIFKLSIYVVHKPPWYILHYLTNSLFMTGWIHYWKIVVISRIIRVLIRTISISSRLILRTKWFLCCQVMPHSPTLLTLRKISVFCEQRMTSAAEFIHKLWRGFCRYFSWNRARQFWGMWMRSTVRPFGKPDQWNYNKLFYGRNAFFQIVAGTNQIAMTPNHLRGSLQFWIYGIP